MVMSHSSRAVGLGSGGGPLGRPVQRLLGAAGQAFARHPFLIKTVSSGFGFAFGDVLFQLGTSARPHKGQPPAAALEALDWQRVAGMGVAGLALAGPLGYAFIMWMEGNIMTAAPHGKLALGVKLTLDQVLGFALWHAALAALSEPHRQACVALVTPRQPAAAAAAKQRRAGKAK